MYKNVICTIEVICCIIKFNSYYSHYLVIARLQAKHVQTCYMYNRVYSN